MSDRVHIPSESWRPPRRQPRALDPQMIRMGVLAAGAVGVVILGMGGYALVAHRSHGIPVVEADASPIRVRPADPGGMVAEGTDEAVMGVDGKPAVAMVAPAAEAPEPQALRAQIAAARQANALPKPVPAPAPAQVAQAAPPAVQRASLSVPPAAASAAVSDMPETKPVAHAAARVPAAAAPLPVASGSMPVASGSMQVQLAAVETQEAALAEWQRLAKRMPDLLGPRRPAVVQAQHDGKTIWRLRTGGFSDTAAATVHSARRCGLRARVAPSLRSSAFSQGQGAALDPVRDGRHLTTLTVGLGWCQGCMRGCMA